MPVLAASPEPLPIRRSPPAITAGCTMLSPGPLVLPEHRAVGRRDADRAGSVHQHDLRDAVDRRQLRRAVAAAVLRAEPARLPGGDVVGGEPAGSGGDDDVADHERRARDAPVRNLPAGVGHRVARPDDRAVTGVERVQDSGATERVDAAVAEGRRRARTGAGIRFPEPGRVAVSPHGLAGLQVVGRHDLVVTALLLREEAIAANREGRPARSDRPAPQLDRAATGTSRSRSAHRERRCRARVLESRASRRRCSIPSDRQERRRSRQSSGTAVSGASATAAAGVGAGGSALGDGYSRQAAWRRAAGADRAASSGSSPPWARSRCSGVGVHRHSRSESASPVMPLVRMSVNVPHASTMAATIDARRGPLERPRLATAHATRARLRTGMA